MYAYSNEFDISIEEWESMTNVEQCEYVEEFMQENPYWKPN